MKKLKKNARVGATISLTDALESPVSQVCLSSQLSRSPGTVQSERLCGARAWPSLSGGCCRTFVRQSELSPEKPGVTWVCL